MDKSSSHHSSDSSSSSSAGQFLRQLNKSSHKISKPLSSSSLGKPPFDPSPPPEPTPPPTENPNPNPNQPPVYNISKADFRDVVQKLTGSPAHDHRISTPPTTTLLHSVTPKPPTSRLHRIRPPPLAQIATFRPLSPLLPPLPSCHAPAESPISAYMRFLHTSSSSALDSSSSADPRRNPPPNPMPQPLSPLSHNLPPPSPLPPFGCFPSPKSPCPLLSSNVLFSPTGMGQLGFSHLPVSPNVSPVPSPRWKNV